MLYFLLSILAIFLLTLETVLPRWLGVGTPHLLLSVLLPFCFQFSSQRTLFFAVLCGLLLDFLPGSLLGLHLFLFSLSALSLSALQRSFFKDPSIPLATLLFGVVSLAYEVVLALVFSGMGWLILAPVVTTTIFALIIYWLLLLLGSRKEILLHA